MITQTKFKRLNRWGTFCWSGRVQKHKIQARKKPNWKQTKPRQATVTNVVIYLLGVNARFF